jgi:hypothetical protein
VSQLPDHFEQFLGPIQKSWAIDPDGVRMPFQIVQYETGGVDGTVGLATLGLSRYELRSTEGRAIRLEFFMSVLADIQIGLIPDLIFQVAMDALKAGEALLRGDVVGPRGPLVPGSVLQAFYVALPVYLPDAFAVTRSEGHDVAVAWLVPVSPAEADYVRSQGWDRFEDLLVDVNPDLNDLYRKSLPVR